MIHINTKKLYTPNFLWGAWGWEVTHSGLDRNNLGKFGLWEDEGKIVAIAIYEMPPSAAILIVDEEYSHLKPDLVAYAVNSLHDNGKLRILLPNGDYEFQHASIKQGFRATKNSWGNAV